MSYGFFVGEGLPLAEKFVRERLISPEAGLFGRPLGRTDALLSDLGLPENVVLFLKIIPYPSARLDSLRELGEKHTKAQANGDRAGASESPQPEAKGSETLGGGEKDEAQGVKKEGKKRKRRRRKKKGKTSEQALETPEEGKEGEGEDLGIRSIVDVELTESRKIIIDSNVYNLYPPIRFVGKLSGVEVLKGLPDREAAGIMQTNEGDVIVTRSKAFAEKAKERGRFPVLLKQGYELKGALKELRELFPRFPTVKELPFLVFQLLMKRFSDEDFRKVICHVFKSRETSIAKLSSTAERLGVDEERLVACLEELADYGLVDRTPSYFRRTEFWERYVVVDEDGIVLRDPELESRIVNFISSKGDAKTEDIVSRFGVEASELPKLLYFSLKDGTVTYNKKSDLWSKIKIVTEESLESFLERNVLRGGRGVTLSQISEMLKQHRIRADTSEIVKILSNFESQRRMTRFGDLWLPYASEEVFGTVEEIVLSEMSIKKSKLKKKLTEIFGVSDLTASEIIKRAVARFKNLVETEKRVEYRMLPRGHLRIRKKTEDTYTLVEQSPPHTFLIDIVESILERIGGRRELPPITTFEGSDKTAAVLHFPQTGEMALAISPQKLSELYKKLAEKRASELALRILLFGLITSLLKTKKENIEETLQRLSKELKLPQEAAEKVKPLPTLRVELETKKNKPSAA